MKLIVFSLSLFLFSAGAFAQSISDASLKRLSLKETPDSLTPAAYHYVGWNFSRAICNVHGLSFEYTFNRRFGIQLELGYKPSVVYAALPDRYDLIPYCTTRKASVMYSGKLSHHYYTRVGKRSFLYAGPYFRFDYLDAKNVLIYDCYGNDYPAYIFTRSTRLFRGGATVGVRYISKRFSFFAGVGFGGGFLDDSHHIVQLTHIEYEDPKIDYRYLVNKPISDLTIDMGFAFGISKRAMFKK